MQVGLFSSKAVGSCSPQGLVKCDGGVETSVCSALEIHTPPPSLTMLHIADWKNARRPVHQSRELHTPWGLLSPSILRQITLLICGQPCKFTISHPWSGCNGTNRESRFPSSLKVQKHGVRSNPARIYLTVDKPAENNYAECDIWSGGSTPIVQAPSQESVGNLFPLLVLRFSWLRIQKQFLDIRDDQGRCGLPSFHLELVQDVALVGRLWQEYLVSYLLQKESQIELSLF